MKNFYQYLSRILIVVLVIMIPFGSIGQEGSKETKIRTNVASCYNYWSVGLFGGLTQFNGDLSRNITINLYSNSIGYNAGFTVTKQFGRVIGVRARIAYGKYYSNVKDKWVWDYKDGNGVPAKITNSFKSTVVESEFQITVNWLNWIVGYKPERIFSSYLIAGIGIDQSSGARRDSNDKEIAYLGNKGNVLNVGNTKGISGDEVALKVSAGLGFDFNLNKHFSVPVEFIWRWQNSDLLDMTVGGAKGMVNDMYSSATVGITYKFGYSCPKVPEKVAIIAPLAVVPPAEPKVRFFVVAPKNIPVGRSVREIFPMRNYVFFNLGSTEIPDRYVLLTKAQVKDFKEEQVQLFTPKNQAGRSER